MLNNQDFTRYQRQISLPDVGEKGQINIQKSHVLVIGLGGLGSAACSYLAAAGVGKIVMVDDDSVEVSNLQRQVAYQESDIGAPKTEALKRHIHALNQSTNTRCVENRMTDTQLSLEVSLADVVLDCSDNFQTRQQVNRACLQARKPLIFASAAGWQGQFAIFDFSRSAFHTLGCYHCLVPGMSAQTSSLNMTCEQLGVMGPVVGCLSNYQALAALQKIATDEFLTPTGVLHCFDGKHLTWQQFRLNRDPHCQVCSTNSQIKSRQFTSTKPQKSRSDV